jgi:hypothetical protein
MVAQVVKEEGGVIFSVNANQQARNAGAGQLCPHRGTIEDHFSAERRGIHDLVQEAAIMRPNAD